MSQSVEERKPFEVRTAVTLENEGQKIFGILHMPITEKPVPAVVMCHGFAGHKAGRFRVYVCLAEQLAKLGIASIRFDYRCCGSSEGDWKDALISDEVSDTYKAMEYMSNLPEIDKNRMGLFGRSLGGSVAVIAAASKKFPIKSLAIWAPAYDGAQWQHRWDVAANPDTSPELRDEMMRFDGYLTNIGFFQEFFQMGLEEKMQKIVDLPLLHIHGEIDDVIAIDHAAGFERWRDSSQSMSEFIRLPNTDHDFTDDQERQFALSQTANWFANTL